MQNSEQYFLRLSPKDNVLVVVKAIQKGQELELEGVKITAQKTIPFGHKVAARALTAGEKIVKFGMPIGSTTTTISAGEHVHTHNLQSDYIPSFGRPGEGGH
jgi:SAF domain